MECTAAEDGADTAVENVSGRGESALETSQPESFGAELSEVIFLLVFFSIGMIHTEFIVSVQLKLKLKAKNLPSFVVLFKSKK